MPKKGIKKDMKEEKVVKKEKEENIMVILREASSPMNLEKFNEIIKEHNKFLNSGGAGGHWQTFITGGIILGVYLDAKGSEGDQAKLSHENLEKLNLEGIVLTYADISGVLCRNQNLKGADLTGSLLTDSDFSGTNFEEANLTNADFSRSKMIGCNFRNANFTGTDLENVDLSDSDLRGAIFEGTSFKNTIMNNVMKD